jgi:phosphotransferase system enzyme I (PtsI)
VDVRDVSKRIAAILTGKQADPLSGRDPVILASDDFTPSETARFDRSKVLALLSQGGSSNAHTSIFARTMGIPAVIGLGSALDKSLDGKACAVDGETGDVYIEPVAGTQSILMAKADKLRAEKEALESYRGRLTMTRSKAGAPGRRLKVYANIGNIQDADAALANDAEGVGLFRSEFLYLGRHDYPDEVLQFESYRKVAEKMAGKEVVVRTLDIGADKKADYFKLPHEENPAMGMRAIRICLTRVDLFKTQLRAIYRASAFGNLAIMFPMISAVKELREAKAIAAEVRADLKARNIAFNPDVPIGVMIEIPAAAICSDILAAEADFFSIGTNDLTQYTLACDRQNESVRGFVDTHNEAVLRLIQMTSDNAHKAGIWCGICGSLGGDLSLTKTFIDMGLDELSVEPSRILGLRRQIMEA